MVIVNYALADHVERLLDSGALVGQRVLLVDNASQPDHLRRLAVRHGAELLLLERNYGFAGAVNRGIAHAGEHGPVLLLNPDVRLGPSDVDELRHALIQRGLTGVTPLLVNVDGSVQVGTAGGPVTPTGFAVYFLFLSHLVPGARGTFYTRRQLAGALRPDWVCMACLLLDRDAFGRYGPIPEHELVYAEDVAWGWTASRAGARFAVVPGVRVVHEQGAAGGSRRWSSASARLALREHGPVKGRVALLAMRVGLGARRLLRRRGGS